MRFVNRKQLFLTKDYLFDPPRKKLKQPDTFLIFLLIGSSKHSSMKRANSIDDYFDYHSPFRSVLTQMEQHNSVLPSSMILIR